MPIPFIFIPSKERKYISREGEVYCKGDFDWEENVNCHPYEVLCHACYYENSRTLKARLTIAYYKTIDFITGRRT